ncbi:MAG: hypothetical protein Q8941_06080 [Bacteroidota bacterium]|nr:hypothetical protein [Bacteroidota bacterium]
MKTDTSKSTILVICMGFLVLSLKWKWALYASLGIGVLSISSTMISQKIEWGWNKLAEILGYIVPSILLSIVFFVFLFPISLLARLSRKDNLMLSKKYKSYFLDTDKRVMDKKSFEKTW